MECQPDDTEDFDDPLAMALESTPSCLARDCALCCSASSLWSTGHFCSSPLIDSLAISSLVQSQGFIDLVRLPGEVPAERLLIQHFKGMPSEFERG